MYLYNLLKRVSNHPQQPAEPVAKAPGRQRAGIALFLATPPGVLCLGHEAHGASVQRISPQGAPASLHAGPPFQIPWVLLGYLYMRIETALPNTSGEVGSILASWGERIILFLKVRPVDLAGRCENQKREIPVLKYEKSPGAAA